MKVNVELKNDMVIINFSKALDVVESSSVRIFNVKKITIETLDVVLVCFDENDKTLGEIFYRIDGKQTINGYLFKEDMDINLISDGAISEDIFKWNGTSNKE